jgi:hypothetical protein
MGFVFYQGGDTCFSSKKDQKTGKSGVRRNPLYGGGGYPLGGGQKQENRGYAVTPPGEPPFWEGFDPPGDDLDPSPPGGVGSGVGGGGVDMPGRGARYPKSRVKRCFFL